MKLEKIISSLKGKLLCFGIQEESYLKRINDNKKIIECSLLNSIDLEKRKKFFGSNKKVLPKNLKKIYGYKNIDTIIVNEEEIKLLEKRLISKFIYLSNTIYIYNVEDKSKVEKRYKRYQAKIEHIKDKDKTILKIDVTLSKLKKWMEPFYFIYDTIIDFFDIISELLVS